MSEIWRYTDTLGESHSMYRAHWFKRLPIIRHARYFRHLVLMNAHYDAWRGVFGMGGPREWEVAYLDAVWNGEA